MDHKFLTFSNIYYSYINYYTALCFRPFTFAMKFPVCRFTNGLYLKTLNTDFFWFLPLFFSSDSLSCHEEGKWEGHLEKIKDMRIFWFERKTLKCCYFYMHIKIIALFSCLSWDMFSITVVKANVHHRKKWMNQHWCPWGTWMFQLSMFDWQGRLSMHPWLTCAQLFCRHYRRLTFAYVNP